MARDGSGIYSVPLGTTAVPNTTIESSKFNAFVDDLEADANTARPITAGGTGATSATAARTALGALDASLKATAGEIITGTDNIDYVTPKGIMDAQPFVTFTQSSLNFNNLINGKITLVSTVNTIGAPTNAKPGTSGTLRIAQDATGGRTLAWNVFWNFGPDGPPTLSTGANVVDRVYYQIDDGGTSADCSFKAGS